MWPEKRGNDPRRVLWMHRRRVALMLPPCCGYTEAWEAANKDPLVGAARSMRNSQSAQLQHDIVDATMTCLDVCFVGRVHTWHTCQAQRTSFLCVLVDIVFLLFHLTPCLSSSFSLSSTCSSNLIKRTVRFGHTSVPVLCAEALHSNPAPSHTPSMIPAT